MSFAHRSQPDRGVCLKAKEGLAPGAPLFLIPRDFPLMASPVEERRCC